MKKNLLTLIAILAFLCGACMLSSAQTYQQYWRQIDSAQSNSLPRTIIDLTEQVCEKADGEGNFPQWMKALLTRMQARLSVSPDSFQSDLRDIEYRMSLERHPVHSAIMHSVVSQLYTVYLQKFRWQVLQRTDMEMRVGEFSSDLREWTIGHFASRIMLNLKASLQQPEALIIAKTKDYSPISTEQFTSGYFHHEVYHLLLNRSFEQLDMLLSCTDDYRVETLRDSLYDVSMRHYSLTDYPEAYTLLALEALKSFYRDVDENLPHPFEMLRGGKSCQQGYQQALTLLAARVNNLPIVSEVRLVQAWRARREGYNVEALKICEQMLREFPKYERSDAFRQLKSQILQPELHLTLPETLYPHQKIELKVRHKNLKHFSVVFKRGQSRVKVQSFTLLPPLDYHAADTLLQIEAPSEGCYQVELEAGGKYKDDMKREVHVMPYTMVAHSMLHHQCRVSVLESATGKPACGKRVSVCCESSNTPVSFTTDETGSFVFTMEEGSYYNLLLTGKRGAETRLSLRGGRIFYTRENKGERVTLLTDRSIYRPGQVVHVKGLAYEIGTSRVLSYKPLTVTLRDANRQEVATCEVTTNEMGSFAAEFTLPAVCLNGIFSLSTAYGRVPIRVESYRRPTFELLLEPYPHPYKLGDTLTLKGVVKALNGMPLQGGSVHYKVRRSYWYRFSMKQSDICKIDSTELHSDGAFEVRVPLLAESGQASDYVRFQVESAYTSQNGETQESSMNLVAGNVPFILEIESPEQLCLDDSVSLNVRAVNFSQSPLAVQGTYKVYRLPYRQKDKTWQKGESERPVCCGRFGYHQSRVLLPQTSLSSGRYRIEVTAFDESGRRVTAHVDRLLYSRHDEAPSYYTPLYTLFEQKEWDAAHPLRFALGSSLKKGYLQWTILSEKQVVSQQSVSLSDSILHLELPYLPSYGKGVSIAACLVYEGRVYACHRSFSPKAEDSRLRLSWCAFRDRLKPGDKEEWRLKIEQPDGRAADAELLAMMYDASLDALYPHRQQVDWSRPQYMHYAPYVSPYQGSLWLSARFERTGYTCPALAVDYLDVAPLFQTYIRTGYQPLMRMMKTSNQNCVDMVEGDVAVFEEAMPAGNSLDVLSIQSQADTMNLEPEQAVLRSNFDETAFFYPQLRTDSLGEVSWTFTLPETLTRWRFKGYAHTATGETGYLTQEVVASKDFMLQPHLPRFVRQGDKTSVSAMLMNLTDQIQSGHVVCELFDPSTDKVLRRQNESFVLPDSGSAVVHFSFTVTDKMDMLGCRMVARSADFSDGEQHLLPVLTDKVHLVETKMVSLFGKSQVNVPFDGLFNNQSRSMANRSLTVELVPDPLWYAVLALPSLTLPQNQDALSWATSYYATALSAHLVAASPELKRQLQKEVSMPDKASVDGQKLKANEAVKTILLDETPWVLEAQDEAGQQSRIRRLLDANYLNYHAVQAIDKLERLQMADGSWSWYPGMRGSAYVTRYVLTLLARLDAMGCGAKGNRRLAEMQQKGMSYIHREAVKEYERCCGLQKTDRVTSCPLPYLYLVALVDQPVPDYAREAHAYFLSHVAAILPWASISDKSRAVVVLNRAGQADMALRFAASLKEHLVHSAERGSYFEMADHFTSWGNDAESVQVAAMEALCEMHIADDVLNEMKLWLLMQKRTQQWKSDVATADAVYSLLQGGIKEHQPASGLRVKIGDSTLCTSEAESSKDFQTTVRRTYTDHDVCHAVRAEVSQTSEGVAWVSFYAQGDERLKRVEALGEGLSVDKELFVKRTTDRGETLIPLSRKVRVQVGEEIVTRLVVRLNRGMDFLQLTDQRAACLEPSEALSGYRWGGSCGYYADVKDASVRFFFDALDKGVYVLEYSCRAGREGEYSTGMATLQCAYAPEYSAHSSSSAMVVNRQADYQESGQRRVKQ